LPVTVTPFYAKYVLQVENSPTVIVTMGLINNVGALAFFPLYATLTKNLPTLKVFISVATINVVVITIVALLPQHDVVYRYNLHLLMSFFAPLTNLSGGFPMEMVLNGVIQYDQLISGKKRAGMYVTMDAIIKQVVDMLSSLLPTAFLILSGYKNNGGCTCGCTTHCDHPYERWHCEGDIAYACSDEMSTANPPFFGEPERLAPCTEQNFPTYLSLHFFTYTIIVLTYVYFIRLCLLYPITPEIRDAIAEGVAKRERDESVMDPITKRMINATVKLDGRDERVLNAVKHYTRNELEMLVGKETLLAKVSARDSLDSLRAKMVKKLKVRFFIISILLLILAMGWIPDNKLHSAIQAIFVILIAGLLMTMSLNLMRQHNLSSERTALEYFINFVRFDRGMKIELRKEEEAAAAAAQALENGDTASCGQQSFRLLRLDTVPIRPVRKSRALSTTRICTPANKVPLFATVMAPLATPAATPPFVPATAPATVPATAPATAPADAPPDASADADPATPKANRPMIRSESAPPLRPPSNNEKPKTPQSRAPMVDVAQWAKNRCGRVRDSAPSTESVDMEPKSPIWRSASPSPVFDWMRTSQYITEQPLGRASPERKRPPLRPPPTSISSDALPAPSPTPTDRLDTGRLSNATSAGGSGGCASKRTNRVSTSSRFFSGRIVAPWRRSDMSQRSETPTTTSTPSTPPSSLSPSTSPQSRGPRSSSAKKAAVRSLRASI